MISIILLLRKGVYLYDYMDNWGKFNETTLLEKEEFYNGLKVEEITDAGYMHGKRVCKNFQIKNLGEYHDLCLKSDTLLLADVFENFSGSWISMTDSLKKRQVKLEY